MYNWYFRSKSEILTYYAVQDYEKNCLPIFRFHLKEKGTACFFSYIAEHRSFYEKVYGIDQGATLFHCLKAAYRIGFERRAEYSLQTPRKGRSFDPEVFYEYACSGIAAVVVAWVRSRMETPVEQVGRDLFVMMSETLSDVRDKYT